MKKPTPKMTPYHVLSALRLAAGGAILGTCLVGIGNIFIGLSVEELDPYRWMGAGVLAALVLVWALRQPNLD
jgi:hypothetical protein